MEGLTVTVRHNADFVALELLASAQEMRNLATVRALNKTAEQGKVFAARAIRDEGYNLKISRIKQAMRVVRASGGNLRASIVVSGKPVPLMEYGAKQTSKGVTVNVLKGRKVIAGAFIAKMPSGHVGVFVRQTGGKHRKMRSNGKASWHQLPIRELYGPSVPDAAANKAVQAAVEQLLDEKFPEILEREHSWLRRKLHA